MEEFLTAAVTMAKITTDSEFAQAVDAIEKLVAERGGILELSKVYRMQSAPVYEVNRYIDQLVAERRITKRQEVTGEWKLVLLRETERMAA